jgi:predicted permease
MFWRKRKPSDFKAEVEAHLELEADRLKEQGSSEEDARDIARRAFGNVTRVQERFYESGRWLGWDHLWQDVRFGLLMLRKNPGFTAVAVLTLALGIGANTAIFSLINSVMLRMLPVHEPERLVQVAFAGKHSGESFVGESFSYPLFKDLRERNQVFSDMAAFDFWDSFEARRAESGSSASGEPAKGQLVSANFFSVLGVNAILGRTFVPDEDRTAGSQPVAVISYGLWMRAFARDPQVVGKKLLVEGTPLTVIGVTPPHFSGANPGQTNDLWALVTMQAQLIPGGHLSLTDPSTNWVSLIARLKPGISAEQARAGLDLLYQHLQRQRDVSNWSEQDRRDFFTHRIVLVGAAHGADYLRKELRQPLLLLMAMVGLVLLIACANVANLLLARGSVREREIAIRFALGARRRRLVRQLLTESVLLALAGGALGVLFAYWAGPVLVALMSRQGANQIALDVHPDLRVLAFTLLVAIVTGIAVGLTPALRATMTKHRLSLHGARNLIDSRTGRNLGAALVVGQLALSLVLVVGAGLLVRTLRNLEILNPGFSRQNVLLFGLDPTRAGYKQERLLQLYQQLLERFGEVPGVGSASYSFLTPISGGGWDNYTSIEGYTPGSGESMDVYLNAVGPRFFETLGTPLLMGRSFGPKDHEGSTPVAVINQTMARRFFAGRNPIGKHLGRWKWNGGREYEIIGVVGDAKYLSLRENTPPTAYLYIPQEPRMAGGVTFELHTALPPAGLVSQVRRRLESLDPRLSPLDFRTLAEQVDHSLRDEKLMSTLSSCFGVLALLLASIGLYGLVSYAVARRTGEIGVRMAFGAQKRDVLRLVLGRGMTLALMGVGFGILGAFGATRLLSSLLYGVNPIDPPTLVVVSLVLSAVALLASYIPARRATKVDPMMALRYE